MNSGAHNVSYKWLKKTFSESGKDLFDNPLDENRGSGKF